MSRSGYCDDCDDNWAAIRWRGQVTSATKGRRGQILLRDLVAALEEMPNKRLIAHELRKDGEVCALGAVGVRRGINLESIDPDDYELVASAFDVAEPLAREIEYQNDEGNWGSETPEERWSRVYEWAKALVNEANP